MKIRASRESFVLAFGLTAPYILSSIFYPIAIVRTIITREPKTPKVNLLIYQLVIPIIIIKALNTGVSATYISMKAYFGFLIFYWYFKTTAAKGINLNIITIIASLITMADAFLLNTYSPFLDIPAYGGQSTYKFFLSFFRPKGFGINSTVTSCLLVSLLFYGKSTSGLSRYTEILCISAVILCLSGTGLILIAAYLLIRLKGIFILAIVIPWIILHDSNMYINHITWKIHPDHISRLFDLKLERWEAVIAWYQNSSIKEFLIGYDAAPFGGDFGYVDMIRALGIIGSLLLSYLIITKLTKTNFSAVMCILIGSFHYAVFSPIAGQILLGMYLANPNITGKRDEL